MDRESRILDDEEGKVDGVQSKEEKLKPRVWQFREFGHTT